jgi:hypothetical protein
MKVGRHFEFGAGDGNRTRVASLEGWNSTIELHPQPRFHNIPPAAFVNSAAACRCALLRSQNLLRTPGKLVRKARIISPNLRADLMAKGPQQVAPG